MAGGSPGGPTPNVYKPPYRTTASGVPPAPRAWGAPGAAGAAGQRAAVQTRARVAAKAAAKVAAAKTKTKTKTTTTTPTPPLVPTTPAAPPTPDIPIEDQALQGNYPTDLTITQNQHLKGLAGKVQLPNAGNYATAMANMQYGPQINATAGRIKGLIAALPGALQSLDKAFANVDAQRALAAPVTSGQGVANLFGGQGGVGAAGAAAVAANQAVQANNTTANQIGQGNDEAAATARRQADWATRIQLLNNMAVNQGRTDLQGELGQRGAAQKAYFDQGLKMRGDMISQAIGNQGALQNQKIAAALASGQVEGMKLSNEQKIQVLKQMGISNAYLPASLRADIQGKQQNIITSQLTNNINLATAKAQLKALKNPQGKDVTSLKGARAAGGFAALAGMILPQGAYGTDATTGRPKVFGDLNTYYRQGVASIMHNLPDSDPKKVKLYVSNELNKIASATNQWVHKNGRYVKVAQPKASK